MSKNPSVLLLEHHLKELKLPTFLRDYDSVGVVCSQERISRNPEPVSSTPNYKVEGRAWWR